MGISAEELLLKYSQDLTHAYEVKRLALIIFDEVSRKIKPLKDIDKRYLEASCLLHDIGYAVDADKHNIHSMNIIIENELDNFDYREIQIIACISRYHRGGLPKKDKHEIYSELDKKERKIVKKIGGILKIADGLARGNKSFIKDIKINYDEKHNIAEFIITPSSPDYCPDISLAVRKRDLFETAFKCQCVLKFNI